MISIIATFLLIGCSDNEVGRLKNEAVDRTNQIKELKSENKLLRESNNEIQAMLDTDYLDKDFKLKQNEKEAAIAQVCMQPFNINFCPNSVTKAGEAVIKDGVSGGANPYFLVGYILKLFFILVLFIAPVLFLLWFWSKRIKPNLTAAARADARVAEAELKLIRLNEDYESEYIKLINRLQVKKNYTEIELDRMDSELEEKVRALETLDEKIKGKEITSKNLDQEVIQKNNSIEELEAFDFLNSPSVTRNRQTNVKKSVD